MIDLGAACIYYGKVLNLTTSTDKSSPDILIKGDTARRRCGVSVLGLGDRNNNGVVDIAIGSSEALMPYPDGEGGI